MRNHNVLRDYRFYTKSYGHAWHWHRASAAAGDSRAAPAMVPGKSVSAKPAIRKRKAFPWQACSTDVTTVDIDLQLWLWLRHILLAAWATAAVFAARPTSAKPPMTERTMAVQVPVVLNASFPLELPLVFLRAAPVVVPGRLVSAEPATPERKAFSRQARPQNWHT